MPIGGNDKTSYHIARIWGQKPQKGEKKWGEGREERERG